MHIIRKIKIELKIYLRMLSLLAKFFFNSAPWEMARCLTINVTSVYVCCPVDYRSCYSESRFGRVNGKASSISIDRNFRQTLIVSFQCFAVCYQFVDKSFDSRFVNILSHTRDHSFVYFQYSLNVVSHILSW